MTYSEIAEAYEAKHKLFSLFVNVTDVCCLKCKHCYMGAAQTTFISFDQVQSLLAESHRMEVVNLVLTGGEFFLHPNYLEILEEARKYSLFTRILTNGYLIDENMARKLKKLAVISVTLSYYSMDPATHDNVTGVSGSHSKVKRAIEVLLEQGVHVGINMLLLHNLNKPLDIVDILDWVDVLEKRYDTKINITIDGKITPEVCGSTKPCQYNYPIEELAEAYRLIAQRRGEPFVVTHAELETRLKTSVCTAGSTQLAVDANGDVRRCLELPQVIGNIGENSLSEIWQSQAQGGFRQLSDFKTCTRCQYLWRCAPCMALSYQQTGHFTHAPSINCANTHALVLSEAESTENVEKPLGLQRNFDESEEQKAPSKLIKPF